MDVVVIAMVLAWAVRGFRVGTLAQVSSLAGLIAGLAVTLGLSQWVGAHWHGARPAVVFWFLRWLVAILAGAAVAACLQWWGELAGKGLREGPLGWVDGFGGLLVGGVVGAVFTLSLIVMAVRLPTGREVTDTVARARTPWPLVRVVSRWAATEPRWLPGHRWLRDQLEATELDLRTRRSS